MMTHRRLLMLGIDSIDWLVANSFAADGRLPNFRGLLDDSHALQFGESNKPLPGSIWTDIATGASAAAHGYIHEVQLRPGTYGVTAVDSSRVAVAPFYKHLDDAGVRCAVVDFPVDYPIRGFRGVQVIDWATEFKLWRFETVPSGYGRKLESRYGRHPLTNYPGTRPGLRELENLKRKLHDGIEIKRRYAVDLLRRREHDFVFFNFAELHKAGHFFWRFHDRTHPEFTTEAPDLVDSLRELYEQMDRALGDVLAELGDGDDLIVITDRGMYADHRGDHLIDALLLKMGFATPRVAGREGQGSRRDPRRGLLRGRKARRLYSYIGRTFLPEPIREALLPMHRSMLGELPPFDWTSTRVFRLPTVGNSYLRINLAGRDPRGVVSPGADYDELLKEIAAEFAALVNTATGEPAVEGVYFPRKLFSGPLEGELPDVAILWNSRAPIDSVTSPRVGVVTGRQYSDRTGNHRPEGFALLRGPLFPGDRRSVDADARQIAPLVLDYFGVPKPATCEMPSGPIWGVARPT